MRIAFIYMNDTASVGRGAGYIASAILDRGDDLTFFDTFWVPEKKIINKIVKGDYDILIISSMTIIFPKALEIIKKIKKNIKIPILLGGIHPTIMGPALLKKHKDIDYLCIGEGESMILDFLENLKNKTFSKVNNLVYRCGKEIISNEICAAEDLSKLPRFRWELFPKEAIVQGNEGFLYVNASRGCPYNCTYCCNGVYLRQYKKSYLRFRPINHVIDELKYLKEKYRPKLFYFGDEMILLDKEYVKKLFKRIKKEIKLPYGCMIRVEHINEDIAKLLKETGCKYVAMGVECGDETFRKKYLNRHMSNEQIINAFKLLKDQGIFTTSFNMIGYPFRNDNHLTKATIKLNKILKPDFVQTSIFFPLPGTKLYDYCIKNNLIDYKKLNKANTYHADSVLKGISVKQKKEEIDSMFNPSGLDINYNSGIDRLPKPFKKVLRFSFRVTRFIKRVSYRYFGYW